MFRITTRRPRKPLGLHGLQEATATPREGDTRRWRMLLQVAIISLYSLALVGFGSESLTLTPSSATAMKDQEDTLIGSNNVNATISKFAVIEEIIEEPLSLTLTTEHPTKVQDVGSGITTSISTTLVSTLTVSDQIASINNNNNTSESQLVLEREQFSSCNTTRTLPFFITNFTEGAVRPNLRDFMVFDKDPFFQRRTIIDKEKQRPYATCRHQNYPFSDHFPHFMQQLYRCWSFWESYPNHQHLWKVPHTNKIFRTAFGKEFTRGVYALIDGSTINVTIVKDFDELYNATTRSTGTGTTTKDSSSDGSIPFEDQESVSAKARRSDGFESDGFEVANVQHMKSLKRALLSLNGLNIAAENDDPSSLSPFSPCKEQQPRITFLNRGKKSSRHLHNAEELIDDLQSNHGYNITLEYFEGKSFEQQAYLMSQWDIVLTPHGAQETGLFFLRDCGGVIEIMPQNYYYPNFFGSLAATAGIHHGVMHNTNNDYNYNGTVKNYWLRWRNTDNFCPSRVAVKEALDTMVDQRRSCCDATATAASIN
eukprot:CAMPEP_0194291078 /NCGR_PEP_ID=MMETSP0169-20130528/42676_1 /TAXON_ID=218684 /ORGANISM="Corethron pennatum, Strain L29A3" /LENGTH=538 /DNA_ID=CAMNT_0039038853 /DNA_START=87 /DNA_END=1703 /DNA_ORIENTATION=+